MPFLKRISSPPNIVRQTFPALPEMYAHFHTILDGTHKHTCIARTQLIQEMNGNQCVYIDAKLAFRFIMAIIGFFPSSALLSPPFWLCISDASCNPKSFAVHKNKMPIIRSRAPLRLCCGINCVYACACACWTDNRAPLESWDASTDSHYSEKYLVFHRTCSVNRIAESLCANSIC